METPTTPWTEDALQNKDNQSSKLGVKGEEQKECTNKKKQARSYENGQEMDSQSNATCHDACVKSKIRRHLETPMR